MCTGDVKILSGVVLKKLLVEAKARIGLPDLSNAEILASQCFTAPYARSQILFQVSGAAPLILHGWLGFRRAVSNVGCVEADAEADSY